MQKWVQILVVCIALIMIASSCTREDFFTNRLTKGDGKWKVDRYARILLTTEGDSVLYTGVDVGEFTFATKGTGSYTLNIDIPPAMNSFEWRAGDNKYLLIKETLPGGQVQYSDFTIKENRLNEQVWTQTVANPDTNILGTFIEIRMSR